MDNIRFGTFVAQLRKEQNLTQKELADRLHVTDKAVSKWETGKGFPDVKLLESLAQTLHVSLVELLQGTRLDRENLSIDEAETVLAQALDQSQRATALRYLRLLGSLLLLGTAFFLYQPLLFAGIWLFSRFLIPTQPGTIAGTDTLTVIVTASPSWLPLWLQPVLQAAAGVVCLVFAVRVWHLVRSMRQPRRK